MGRRGPQPQPTALKIARGNPGKRPLNTEEPQLPAPDLTAPKGLKGRALREWQELGPTLLAAGVLTMADLKCFLTYCQTVGDEERFEKLVDGVKPEEALRLGYAAHLLKVRGQLRQYEQDLGLTPASRSGVKAKKPVDPADERRRRFFGMKGGKAPEVTA